MNMSKVKIEVEGATAEQIFRYREILTACLSVGALDGVRNGKTILHFNELGVFQRVQFDYTPWVRRFEKQ